MSQVLAARVHPRKKVTWLMATKGKGSSEARGIVSHLSVLKDWLLSLDFISGRFTRSVLRDNIRHRYAWNSLLYHYLSLSRSRLISSLPTPYAPPPVSKACRIGWSSYPLS